jgi:hypothetical protein
VLLARQIDLLFRMHAERALRAALIIPVFGTTCIVDETPSTIFSTAFFEDMASPDNLIIGLLDKILYQIGLLIKIKLEKIKY